jgi:hypothetical protein
MTAQNNSSPSPLLPVTASSCQSWPPSAPCECSHAFHLPPSAAEPQAHPRRGAAPDGRYKQGLDCVLAHDHIQNTPASTRVRRGSTGITGAANPTKRYPGLHQQIPTTEMDPFRATDLARLSILNLLCTTDNPPSITSPAQYIHSSAT